MAGSYNHVVTEDGSLASNEVVVDMLETGGDVFEAVEEMYGMIWWLAFQFASLSPGFRDAKEMVRDAQANYKSGLQISREVHQS